MIQKFAQKYLSLLLAITLVVSLGTPTTVSAQGGLKAFPTAEGYGAFSKGGRGGRVIQVTNLNDSGPGSLREALTASGPRTVVFRVSGYIPLKSKLIVTEPFLTVAGQTAPGDGVCTRNAEMVFATNDVIIRHMCSRTGDNPTSSRHNADGIRLDRGKRIMLDHFSTSWSLDESLQIWFSDADGITVQNSLFAEPLDDPALRPDQAPGFGHGFGPLVGNAAQKVSFIGNVIASAERRSPLVQNSYYMDIINNLIYNWGWGGTMVLNQGSPQPKLLTWANVMGNVYKRGPDANRQHIFLQNLEANAKVYIDGNIFWGGADADKPVWGSKYGSPKPAAVISAPAEAPFEVDVKQASEVQNTILDNVGRTKPNRDDVDEAIIASIRNGTGKITARVRNSAAGGYKALASGTPYPDTDKDGMDDNWETQNGLQVGTADNNGDANGNGYTNLEDFINELAGDTISGGSGSSSGGSTSGSTSGGSTSSSGSTSGGSTTSSTSGGGTFPRACHLYDSTTTPSPNFGVAYNALSLTKELLITVTCNQTNATATVGTGQGTQYIYKNGYQWTGTNWLPLVFTGAQTAGEWIVGQASAPVAYMSQENYFVAFICQWDGVAWKCGCADAACTTPQWQLQAFRQ